MKLLRLAIAAVLVLILASCETVDKRHHVIVSVRDQRLALLDQSNVVATYRVSTSKFAIGDGPGSRGTPLGELEIAQKIGAGLPIGTVLKDRRPTGEILVPDAPGRDPIVTRILWLRGKEPQNANAYSRFIYIHGTAEERNIGHRASYGCVRMRSRDVVQLFDLVGKGAQVTITDQPLSAYVPGLASDESPVPTKAAKAGMVIR
jgi:lipoprotein-anchoring transpeptidase ErfK/SrfK